jgi:N-acetylglucosaminyl-diphospho-decaprenol L-rhamnosyltransferase
VSAPTLGVVVVAYNSAADLPGTLGALAPQLAAGDQVVVVDNASPDDSAAVARRVMPDALVLETGVNGGFAGGTVAGARAVGGCDLLLFLNPDAVPADGCLDALRAAAAAHPQWGSWQALVTLPGGDEVNTAGNLVHFLGFGWAGGHGTATAALDHAPRDVGFASGAALVVRREAWAATGGFFERYFMYGEDLDLGLRLRLAGWENGVVPAARVDHDYEFAKGDYKWFHLERNRWWTLIGDYPTRLLLLLAPALLAFELALLPVAARDGWLGAKLRAQRAALRELPAMWRRRRAVQATARVDARTFAAGLTASLDSPFLATAHRIPGAAWLVVAYWRLVQALL